MTVVSLKIRGHIFTYIRKGFKNDLVPMLKKYDQITSGFKEVTIKNEIEKNCEIRAVGKEN